MEPTAAVKAQQVAADAKVIVLKALLVAAAIVVETVVQAATRVAVVETCVSVTASATAAETGYLAESSMFAVTISAKETNSGFSRVRYVCSDNISKRNKQWI